MITVRSYRQGDRGAAMIIVLVFTVLILILITSMLSVTGNEIVISGMQRDSVRAMDLAQAGLTEAMRRMEEGRKYFPSFTGSLQSSIPGSAITVTVVRQFVGVNSAYQEIRADARVGRSTRRLSTLVLHRAITFPPNITFAGSVIEQGSADISCGDAYARTFIQYKNYPSNTCAEPPTMSYSGWRMSKATPGEIPACYTHDACVAANPANPDVARWYPATRRTEASNTTLGADIAAQRLKCPAGGGGSLPSGTVPAGAIFADNTTATGTEPLYGFDTDDPAGAPPPQAITSVLPCGLPYKWQEFTFPDEGGVNVTRWIKSINFEQWFALYWRWDEAKLTVVKRNGGPCIDAYCTVAGVQPDLVAYPQFGAVPPFPTIDTVDGNYNCRAVGGGVVNSLPITCADPPGTSDLGCKSPQMACSPAVDRPVLVVFEAGAWQFNGTLQGHGTIVINGNATVNGNFEFWGTIIVNGQLTLGAGTAVIHGGLVADSTLRISGNITVEGGGTITNVPTGRSIITGKGWWER